MANQNTIPNPNPFDATRRRTYRDEFTAGIDRELLPGVRGSLTYIRKREHEPTGRSIFQRRFGRRRTRRSR